MRDFLFGGRTNVSDSRRLSRLLVIISIIFFLLKFNAMVKFDLMKPYGIRNNRIYFKSRTNDNLYYFEFSWKYIKQHLFNSNTIKWIGLVY